MADNKPFKDVAEALRKNAAPTDGNVGDGVALVSALYPEDTELIEFCRELLATAPEAQTGFGDKLRRLAGAHLAFNGELLNPDAVEEVQIEVPVGMALRGLANRLRDVADGEHAFTMADLREIADRMAAISVEVEKE